MVIKCVYLNACSHVAATAYKRNHACMRWQVVKQFFRCYCQNHAAIGHCMRAWCRPYAVGAVREHALTSPACHLYAV